MSNGNKPAAKFRLGYVTVTVWRNSDFYNVVVSRSYKDDKDEWKDTDQLGAGDLLNAAKLLERAEEFIAGEQ
jgi:PHD/YefM family antitoxin component YafN of YafNO toxin-antitoxin module